MSKPVNRGPETARKATDALKGKKAPVPTTKTGGGQDTDTAGKIVSWPSIQKLHDEHHGPGK